jgi:hypothetical protein
MSSSPSLIWPLVFAVGFFLVPTVLAYTYPSYFWAVTDYEPLGLADALNMAYRLADLKMYKASGMSYHPGVPFYLLSWLALAIAGYPTASDPNFFRVVIDHVEDYHRTILLLAALVGSAGVFIFVRAVRNLVPISVALAAVLLWLVSTPATVEMFMSPSIDSFAILLNALFLAIVVPLSYEKDLDPRVLALAGAVGALGYLNKLSYIYVPLALSVAILSKLILCRVRPLRSFGLIAIYVGSLLLVILVVAFFVMGWDAFRDLREYHESVIWGSGLYGGGDPSVVSSTEVWRAIVSIPANRAYAVPIALFGGGALAVGGLITGLKLKSQLPVAVLSTASASAAVLSALFVIKHYDLHYTAGVSATLPACFVCFYLLAQAWQIKFRSIVAAAVVAAMLVMGNEIRAPLISTLYSRVGVGSLAQADLREINSYLAESSRTVEFGYRAPFADYGKGFVVVLGSVPRMTDEYLRNSPRTISSLVARLASRDVGAYVIDKGYFPTAESVKVASNVVLLGQVPVKFKDTDKLIELRTVFLLIRDPS